MSTSFAEEHLIQVSFERLQSDLDTHSAVFYEALFRRAPEIRTMFRDDLAGQGMKFMTTLGQVIKHLQNPSDVTAKLSELGRLHASIGVISEQFEPMGEALIDTLRSALQDDFTAELEAAWRNAYADISSAMIQEGKIP